MSSPSSRGSVRWYLIAALLAVAAASSWAQPAHAGTVPTGFQETTAFSGLTNPSAISFAPDGRVFVAEKSGLIKVYDGLGDTTPDTFADLRTEVYNFWDRGLLGMVLDPDFPNRPYLYVLYTRNAEPGGTPPRWVQAGGDPTSDPCPNPPGATGDGCVVTGRLSRLTVTGNAMSADTPLITDWCQQYPSHSIGDLAFGADGALYVSGGDGASFNFTDWGQHGNPLNPCGDPPGGVGATLTPPTAEGGALRSQDARTTSDPTGLDGAILRVDPDTGQALPDNPLTGDENRRRIVAFGLRNPFRFTIRPGTDEVWLGDVGWTNTEEIDRVLDPSDSTADNFGWPCYEGNVPHAGYASANLNLCQSLYSGGPVVAPYLAYQHSDEVVSGESCPTGSSSITGLDFYQAGPFPNIYNGALFFADYSRNCIWAILPGGDGLPDTSTIETFDAGAASPVDVEVGPQGDLFYADLNGGTVRRVTYSAGNHPPVADATATPANGASPLTVELDATGSSDQDADPLSFAWDLDGDGEFDDSSAATLSHIYAQGGVHVASVRVSDPDGETDTASVSIQVDNTVPNAAITAPSAAQQWRVGETVEFAGTATDPEQGTLPPSAFGWELSLNHCPSNCHAHQLEAFSGIAGGSFSAPDHEYPSSLTMKLTVTDAGGLSDTDSVTIDPRTVELTLESSPPGLQLALNSLLASAPLTETVIEGSQNTVAAPGMQSAGSTIYVFDHWSDDGHATHDVSADQSQTLEAVYQGMSVIDQSFTDTVNKVMKMGPAPKKCKKAKKGTRAAKKCRKKKQRRLRRG